MERDFMGLNSKDSLAVKEEVVDGGCEESGFARSPGISWPSSHKASALPQFMSLKSKQDEKPLQNGQAGYPIHDVKMHPFSTMSPFLWANFMDTNHKFGGGTMKQQFHGANPHATEQWTLSKASDVPAQLTIFYGGAVNVIEDVSPEKAQAIMLLAGNMYTQSNMNLSKLHMQAPASKHPPADNALANQSMNMQPCFGLPSPMSVSSHPIDQPGANNDDFKVFRTTSGNKTEPPGAIPSMGSVAASVIISSAVPQARKASLARFLEKRKERVMSAAPYDQCKKAVDCTTPESNDICSTSLSVIKETH